MKKLASALAFVVASAAFVVAGVTGPHAFAAHAAKSRVARPKATPAATPKGPRIPLVDAKDAPDPHAVCGDNPVLYWVRPIDRQHLAYIVLCGDPYGGNGADGLPLKWDRKYTAVVVLPPPETPKNEAK